MWRVRGYVLSACLNHFLWAGDIGNRHTLEKFIQGGIWRYDGQIFVFKAPFSGRPRWILMAIPGPEIRLDMGAYTLFYNRVYLDRPPHPHRINSQWS